MQGDFDFGRCRGCRIDFNPDRPHTWFDLKPLPNRSTTSWASMLKQICGEGSQNKRMSDTLQEELIRYSTPLFNSDTQLLNKLLRTMTRSWNERSAGSQAMCPMFNEGSGDAKTIELARGNKESRYCFNLLKPDR